jgi:hypothetical protein
MIDIDGDPRMVRFNCSLDLVRRLWPVVDGGHYDGEILRFRLVAETIHGGAHAKQTRRDITLELRIGGELLAQPAWDALCAREVASHGRAWLCERLQRDGLPEHSPATLILNSTTDKGAYIQGSPFSGEQLLPGRSFQVDSVDASLPLAAGA